MPSTLETHTNALEMSVYALSHLPRLSSRTSSSNRKIYIFSFLNRLSLNTDVCVFARWISDPKTSFANTSAYVFSGLQITNRRIWFEQCVTKRFCEILIDNECSLSKQKWSEFIKKTAENSHKEFSNSESTVYNLPKSVDWVWQSA